MFEQQQSIWTFLVLLFLLLITASLVYTILLLLSRKDDVFVTVRDKSKHIEKRISLKNITTMEKFKTRCKKEFAKNGFAIVKYNKLNKTTFKQLRDKILKSKNITIEVDVLKLPIVVLSFESNETTFTEPISIHNVDDDHLFKEICEEALRKRGFVFLDFVDGQPTNITELKNNTIIKVNVQDLSMLSADVQTPPVGVKQDIQTLIDRYQIGQTGQKLIKDTHKFTHWREIKGDGNCYYRAFMLGLIENLVNDRGNQQIFDLLFENLDTVIKEVQEEPTGDDDLQMLLKLKKWFQKLPQTMEKVVEDINESRREDVQDVQDVRSVLSKLSLVQYRPVQSLDRCLVLFARLMCRSFILKHLDWSPITNGLTLRTNILSEHKDITITEYIKDYVTESNSYAEGIIIDPGILPNAFQLNCFIFQLYPNEVTLIKTNLKSKYRYKFNINLLFFPNRRGGHYCYLVPVPIEKQQKDDNPADVEGFSFLKIIFPNCDDDVILEALKASGGNIDRAVAIILSSNSSSSDSGGGGGGGGGN